jgi:hypothetical protein
MPVKSFKFVSPGVFINEIDNSFRPRRPEAIGPVVVGRSVRGLAMQPVKLESFSDFLTMYGDTVPGNAGGDIYRDGNYQSPMYGTYAAKAFLNASVAPVTFVRLLGSQNDNATDAGKAGWQTTKDTTPAGEATVAENGGSYGLWVFPDEGIDAATSALEVTASMSDSQTLTITAADGTDYAMTTDISAGASSDGVIGLSGVSTAAARAQRVAEAVNATTDSKITASPTDGSSATITLTQVVAGAAGNTSISSVVDGLSLADFSGGTADIGSGTLAAVWYIDQSASIQLSGTLAGGSAALGNTTSGVGTVIESDASGHFTAFISGSKSQLGTDEKIVFNFDDTDQRFIRKVFNTNPQLVKNGGFYATSLERNYWLGETFEQELREGNVGSLTGSSAASILDSKMYGVVLPIERSGEGPGKMRLGTQEAETGWVIGQDVGAAASWDPAQALKLFRLKGRGHGEWLHKNVKISIEKIRYSNTQTTDFGSFSVVLRSLTDTDSNPVILERFDNLSLDPRSPNYISRKIGDQYYQWNETERRLRLYGEYANQSKFIYVSDVNEGNIQNVNSLIPFGYFGPPNFASVTNWSGSASDSAVSDSYISTGNTFGTGSDGGFLSASYEQLHRFTTDGLL